MKYKVTDVGSNVIGEVRQENDWWIAEYRGNRVEGQYAFKEQSEAEKAVRKAHQRVLDRGARPA